MARKMALTRKARYSQSGFTEPEAQILKQIPIAAPYSKILRQDRIKLLRQANKEGWTERKYVQAILHSYRVRGWLQEGERLNKSAIFKMVRDYQAIWRNTAPEDEVEQWISPSAKKSHHGNELNHQKLLRQKREYNARPEVKIKRAKYRQTHRTQIAEARRKNKEFKRNQGKI